MRLHWEHNRAVFLTLDRQTRQVMATVKKVEFVNDLLFFFKKKRGKSNIHLLKVVFTKVCSLGKNSVSGGWIDETEVRRPIGVNSPASFGDPERGLSGNSGRDRYRIASFFWKSVLTRRMKGMLS